MAGGGRTDLRPGKEKLSAAQAGAGHAGDSPRNRGRSQSCFTGFRLLWTIEHRFHRASQSDGPSWDSCAGSPHLGHGEAYATTLRLSGMVASLLSWMSRPHESLRVAFAEPRERGGKRLAQRYRQRTPAMAAGKTNRRWNEVGGRRVALRYVFNRPFPTYGNGPLG